MELKEYLRIFQKNFSIILLMVVVSVLVSLIFVFRAHATYQVNASLTLVPKSNLPASIYEYDNYYALQSASLFANTIAAWLRSPSNVKEIYQKAGLSLPSQNPKVLVGLIKPVLTPNSFSLGFQINASKEDEAKKLGQSTIGLIKERIEQYNRLATSKTQFTLSVSEPVVLQIKPNYFMIPALAVFVGLVLGIFLALLKEYLKG